MSVTFYDLMRYAQTGIASPEMTHYDKMKALAMCKGGFPVATLTGIPPLSFKSDGTPLTAWSMKGNGSQQGTPTPSAPIQPEECGDKTANLYDISAHDTSNGYENNTQLNSDGSTATWGSSEITEYIPIEGGEAYTFNGIGSYNSPSFCFYDEDKQFISGNKYSGRSKITFTAPNNARYFRFTHIKTALQAMCVKGNTLPADFIPFGYALPISCGGTTQTVYLQEPLRKIGDYADKVEQDGTVTRAIYELDIDSTKVTGLEEKNWVYSC